MRWRVEKGGVLGWNPSKYRLSVGQLIWYTTKVGPDVTNVARELEFHISHPGPEHWKKLGRLIGYLKVKNIKGIIIRRPKVLKFIMF